jgi:hypothetical protein
MGGWNREGIAGFFEDLPALLVVLVAVAIFILSIAGAYAAYGDYLQQLRFHEQAVEFSESIRTYEFLTYNQEEGKFQADALNETTAAQMAIDFHPENVGLHWNVRVVDVSGYGGKYTWSAGETVPQGVSRIAITSPLTIRNNSDQIRGARLVVTVWR